jgi:hypothetical protein
MYGLKERGFIANQELKVVRAKQGYIPSKFTPGLFTHKTRNIAFSLVLDDFGVKYEKKEDMDHLVKMLGDQYPIKADLKAELYLVIGKFPLIATFWVTARNTSRQGKFFKILRIETTSS